MARQPGKPSAGGKRRKPAAKRRSKTRGTDRSIYLGVALTALLILLVTLSVITLTSGNNKKTAKKDVPDKTLALKERKPASSSASAKNGGKVAENVSSTAGLGNEDVASLIRLVLFDYEISRSAVEERISNTPKGRTILYFNVKCHESSIKDLQEALSSVLRKKGYRVVPSSSGIAAESLNDSVKISFISTDKEAMPQKTVRSSKGDKNGVGADKKIPGERPEPPAPADVVARLAILLDDGGNNLQLAERYVKMKYPVGIAVLPHLKYSEEVARLASSYGKTVFLHFPMEPKSYPSTDPGEGAVLLSMPEILIDGVTKMNFESLGVPVDGFNNHMGSAITEDKTKMAQVMKAAKGYVDVFVDSRTTAKSAAYEECVKAGLRCGVNKRFIDNDSDVNAIIAKIYEAAELAKKNGEVIVIGHIRENTLEALEIALPILESRRIAIVPVTSAVK